MPTLHWRPASGQASCAPSEQTTPAWSAGGVRRATAGPAQVRQRSGMLVAERMCLHALAAPPPPPHSSAFAGDNGDPSGTVPASSMAVPPTPAPMAPGLQWAAVAVGIDLACGIEAAPARRVLCFGWVARGRPFSACEPALEQVALVPAPWPALTVGTDPRCTEQTNKPPWAAVRRRNSSATPRSHSQWPLPPACASPPSALPTTMAVLWRRRRT